MTAMAQAKAQWMALLATRYVRLRSGRDVKGHCLAHAWVPWSEWSACGRIHVSHVACEANEDLKRCPRCERKLKSENPIP